MFNGLDSSSHVSAVRLTIEPDGTARFIPELKSEGASPVAAPSSRLVLMCSQGVLSWSGSIRDLRESNMGDPLVGPDRITFRVQRGSDRALYVETHEVAAGLAYMFLPIGTSETRNFRFATVD